MVTECPNCHHRFNPTSETHQARKSDRIFLAIMITIIILAISGIVLYDYYHVTPPSHLTFTTVALTTSGLNQNVTSHPVFDVIFKFTGNGKFCLSRRLTIVSSTNLTLAKSIEPDARYMCYVTDELFVIEVTGPAISLPNSFDKQKALFNVDMEFRDENISRDNFYHVTCKGLALQMDSRVPCDTTLV